MVKFIPNISRMRKSRKILFASVICTILFGVIFLYNRMRTRVPNSWEIWTDTGLSYMETLRDIKCPTFPEIVARDRTLLKKVPRWLMERDYERSLDSYGVPRHQRALIDSDVGNEVTISDLLVWIGLRSAPSLQYLEIGASYGKNFYQVMSSVPNAVGVALDLESINPTLERMLTDKNEIDRWPTPESTKRKASTMVEYTLKARFPTFDTSEKTVENGVLYVASDEADFQPWKQMAMQGFKFDLVFSDVAHSIDVMRRETDYLIAYELLAEEFVVMWDGLNIGIETDFKNEICRTLEKELSTRVSCRVIYVRGPLGTNEGRHGVGIAVTDQRRAFLDPPLSTTSTDKLPCAFSALLDED